MTITKPSSLLWTLAVALAAALNVSSHAADLLPGFEPAARFDEQTRWSTLASGVRVHVSAPQSLDSERRVLVLYATPNGSTIEQTLGCRKSEALDWRYDIQHVAAQLRLVREFDPRADYVLAVVQAPKLSWPAFRRDESEAGQIILDLVQSLAADVKATSVVLSCHSGGGSFLFGTINAHQAIPDTFERIVLLDANYSYSDDDRHGDKLLAWLARKECHRLVVIAYDDREVVLNGRKAIGPEGGTFRATARMTARIGRDRELTESQVGPWLHTRDKAGQVRCFVHTNAENKILHTALVGDMNGLVHALTLGTEQEEKWGRFGGPRAYDKWIQAEPSMP
jgi:hypothetical protein